MPCKPRAFGGYTLCLLHLVEQLEHSQTKRVGYDFNGVQRRVGVPVLDPAQVGLIEATLFTELDLAHASLLTQRANTKAELLG